VPKRGDLADYYWWKTLPHAATVWQRVIEAPISLLGFAPDIRDSV